MPRCPHCGNEIDRTHYYCGQCGKALTDEADNVGAAPVRKTTEYLSDVLEDGIDEDRPGHTHLERDLAAALVDSGVVGSITDTDRSRSHLSA